MLDLSLEGKVAIITGGSKGIGKAVALRFAEHGADVALAARGEEDLNLVAKEMEGLGRRALAVPTDVQGPGAGQNLVDRTVAELGGIDVLVNNAGAAPFFSTIESLKPSGFEKYFRINFHCAFYATQAAAPHPAGQGTPRVGDQHGQRGRVHRRRRASPTTGRRRRRWSSLTRTAGAGVGRRTGSACNAIAPGWVESEMNSRARQDEPSPRTSCR